MANHHDKHLMVEFDTDLLLLQGICAVQFTHAVEGAPLGMCLVGSVCRKRNG